MSAISPLFDVRSLTFSKQDLALSLIPSIVIPIISKRFIASRISNPHYELIQGVFSLALAFAILQLHSRTWVINAIFATVLCGVGNRLSNRFESSHQQVSEPHTVLSHEIKSFLSVPEVVQTRRYLAFCQKNADQASQETCRYLRKTLHNALFPHLTGNPWISSSMNSYFENKDVSFWKEGDDLKIGHKSSRTVTENWTISIDPNGNYSYENWSFQWTKEIILAKNRYRIELKEDVHHIHRDNNFDSLGTVEEHLEKVELLIEQLCFKQHQVIGDLTKARNKFLDLSFCCLESAFKSIRRNQITTFSKPVDLFCRIVGLKPSFKAQTLRIESIWSPVASSAFAAFKWEIRCGSNGSIYLKLSEKLDRPFTRSSEYPSLLLEQDRGGHIFIHTPEQTFPSEKAYRIEFKGNALHFYDLKSNEVFITQNDLTLTKQDQKLVEAEKQKALEKILASLTLFCDILRSPASVILGKDQAFNFQGQQIPPEQLDEATKLNSHFRQRFYGDNLPIYQFLVRNLYKENLPVEMRPQVSLRDGANLIPSTKEELMEFVNRRKNSNQSD